MLLTRGTLNNKTLVVEGKRQGLLYKKLAINIYETGPATRRKGLLPVIGVDDFGQLTTHARGHCFRCCSASHRAFANGAFIVVERLRGVFNQFLISVEPVLFTVWTNSCKGVGVFVIDKFGSATGPTRVTHASATAQAMRFMTNIE